jgi:hypothetical protein
VDRRRLSLILLIHPVFSGDRVMASSRKNRAASPRAKAGVGAARAASQARSLPDEDVVVAPVSIEADATIVPDAIPEVTVPEATVSSEVTVSEAAVSSEVTAPEAVIPEAVTESVVESIIEIVTDFEPALLVDEVSSIGEVSIPEEIIEAEIEISAPISEEIPAKAAVTTPRNKSKVSNPKSSVQRPKGDKTMTQETEKSAPLATKKETAIAKTGSALPVRPVTPSELTVVGMISSAGERPIGAATMAVFGTYLNGRPIEASSLKLFEILPGDRPVFSTEIAYVPGTPFGGRPIMVSPAGLLGAEEVMGSRPIFSNDIVDPDSASLMGYLD